MATNPFETQQKTYVHFPNDEFIDACVLSYQTADLPPGPLATTNDRVKSARFLMGGYVKDESGQIKCDDTGKPIIVRKWTKWMRVSNNERSAMMNLFSGFDNFFDILQDCENGGRLWTTPMKILLEASEKYQNIIKIKPGTNTDVVQNCYYSDEYIPYKIVKAYGNPEKLVLAGCKFKSGVKTFTPDEMSDGDNETNA
jgi:hypothetical protein